MSKPLAGRRYQTSTRRSFFIDVGMLRTTMVVQMRSGSWRDDIMHRLGRTELPDSVCQQLARGAWRIDGKLVSSERPIGGLRDSTLRLAFPGLRGGMPSKNHYSLMSKAELHQLCVERGIPRTRKGADGKHITKNSDEIAAESAALDRRAADRERKAKATP